MTNPPPRPALQRAADAEVHPARPGLAQLRAIPARTDPEPRPERTGPRPASTSDALRSEVGARKAGKPAKGKGAKRDKGNQAQPKAKVRLSADLAKQLSRKAAESGYEPDEVIALLVQSWLET